MGTLHETPHPVEELRPRVKWTIRCTNVTSHVSRMFVRTYHENVNGGGAELPKFWDIESTRLLHITTLDRFTYERHKRIATSCSFIFNQN